MHMTKTPTTEARRNEFACRSKRKADVACWYCDRIFSTRAGYDAHECQRSSERSDEYRRMAAADELRKRARTLRAQARRQEAAGDRAAAEATRSEVRALLRRARSALRSRGSAPTPERECNEQDRGTVRSGKTMS